MGLFSRNKKQEDEKYYIKNPDKKRDLTEEELFGISLSLIVAEQNGAYMDSLETGKTHYPLKQTIQEHWGIYNRDNAMEFMENRIQEGRRKLFNRLLEIYIAQDCVDAEYIDFTGTEFEIKESDVDPDDDEEEADYVLTWQDVVGYLENLDKVYELDDANAWFGDMEKDLIIGTDAWDFSGIVFIARVSYTLGYITESEAWKYINHTTKMAKRKFTNWDSYATSYMLGRAMLMGDDGKWENVAGFGGDALNKKQSQSPWIKLKW